MISVVVQTAIKWHPLNLIKFQLPFNNIKGLSDYSRRWQVKGLNQTTR